MSSSEEEMGSNEEIVVEKIKKPIEFTETRSFISDNPVKFDKKRILEAEDFSSSSEEEKFDPKKVKQEPCIQENKKDEENKEDGENKEDEDEDDYYDFSKIRVRVPNFAERLWYNLTSRKTILTISFWWFTVSLLQTIL